MKQIELVMISFSVDVNEKVIKTCSSLTLMHYILYLNSRESKNTFRKYVDKQNLC